MTDPAEVIRWALEVEPGANPEAMDALDVLTAKADLADRYREALEDILNAADREPAETPETEWPEGGLPHGEHPHDYGYGPASAVSSEPAPRSTPIPCTTPHKMGEKPND